MTTGTSRVRSTGLGLMIILANVLLVALVAIGISERGFAGWWQTLRGEWTPLDDAVTFEDPFAATQSPDDEATTATAEPTADEVAITTAAPTTTTEEPGPELVANRYEAGEDLTVVVLGDQTGVDGDDWVGAWARLLAHEHEVELRAPRADDPTRYDEPVTLGEDGEGGAISMFNASVLGGTPDYATQRLSLLVPEDPDLIVVNYGRSNTEDDLPDQLEDLTEAIATDFPDAELHLVVQPPRRDGGPVTSDAVRSTAKRADLSLIDVAKVFYDEGLLDSTVSPFNPLSVSAEGDDRWAEIVQEHVFGSVPEAPALAPPVEQAPVNPVPVEPAPSVEPTTEPEPTYEPPPYTPPPTYEPPPWTPPPWTPPPWTPPPTEPDPTEPAPTDPPTEEPTDPIPTDPVDPGTPVEPTP